MDIIEDKIKRLSYHNVRFIKYIKRNMFEPNLSYRSVLVRKN